MLCEGRWGVGVRGYVIRWQGWWSSIPVLVCVVFLVLCLSQHSYPRRQAPLPFRTILMMMIDRSEMTRRSMMSMLVQWPLQRAKQTKIRSWGRIRVDICNNNRIHKWDRNINTTMYGMAVFMILYFLLPTGFHRVHDFHVSKALLGIYIEFSCF